MKVVKTRKMRNEYKMTFMWNVIALILTVGIAYLLLPDADEIGTKNMFILFAADGAMMLTFMYLLEKYTITVSGLYEHFLIALLSSLYSFVLISAVNLILFTSTAKLIADSVLFAAKILGVFITDLALSRIRNNKKLYQKAKMLIIDSSPDNFARTKRIKYGVLNNYDSWYESVEKLSNEELYTYVRENFPKYDAICVLDCLEDERYEIAVDCALDLNKDLFIVPKLIDVGKTNARIVRFDDVLTLYMPEKALSKIELFLKRAIDIVISLVGLVFAAIPMLVVALLIKLTSPGPVFYTQKRLTKNKKEFDIYKFRTMVPDAEKLSGPKFAEKDDPRITPIGKILRSCRLDELPQILNILKGDMSVVGPRPERAVFVKQFEEEIENYDYRFTVKAGLTSLSHVYGRYSTYIHDRTYYDLFYITHYSLFLDLKIILLTTKTLFLKSAAEGVDDFNAKKTEEKKEAEVN